MYIFYRLKSKNKYFRLAHIFVGVGYAVIYHNKVVVYS